MSQEQQIARKEIRNAVHSQIDSDNPHISKVTYERLLHEGFPVANAIDAIASVLLEEMYDMVKSHRMFDLERYTEYLNKLPKLPWE